MDSATAQAMNAHLLSVNGQLSSTVTGGSGVTSESDMTELDGLSVLMNSNYTNSSGGSSNRVSQGK